jgi:hypothetical protein
LRIKVSDTNIAIDEIEINTRAALEQDLTENLAITPSPGYSIDWDGNDADFYSAQAGARTPSHDGLASEGAKAFGSSELDFGIHFIGNVADGRYGNASSWISDRGVGGGSDEDPFVGIAFAQRIDISIIAFGRDNGDTTEGGCGGTCVDRSVGVYTIQVTTASNPGVDTPETNDAATGWETIGTIEYKSAAPPGFNISLRHAYHVAKGGNPIPATGLRFKVSDGNIAIDEIEVNPRAVAIVPPVSDLLSITPASGFGIDWDGNEGEYTSPDKEPPARDNVALPSHGGVAFGSSEADLGVHFIKNVNDGIYGNAHSWIAKFSDPADTNPFIGVTLTALTPVRSVAWGRDNGDTTDCCGGTLTDRALGTYILQATRVPNAGRETIETGDAATGWQTVGTFEYKGAFQNLFTPHLRHRYGVSQQGGPLLASALRLRVSSNQLAIDELEINPEPVIDQNVLAITTEAGFTIKWDGNNGDYFTTNSPALAPENDALASKGSTAIGSSQADLGTHFIKNVNDGRYGNASSWIADFVTGDIDPWIGVAFGKSVPVSSVAWGRDNGDATDCCGGNLIDRAAGTYILQFTQADNPGVETAETGDPVTGWASIGQLQYRGGGTVAFRHHLRHEYQVAQDGAPINATAVRIKVSSNQLDLDEIEINSKLAPVGPVDGMAPKIDSIVFSGGEITITWSGTARLESADVVTGSWSEVPGATSPFKIPVASAAQKFYRLRN